MDSILNLTIIATLMILGVLNERLNKICATMTRSACFLIIPRTIYPGMVPPTSIMN